MERLTAIKMKSNTQMIEPTEVDIEYPDLLFLYSEPLVDRVFDFRKNDYKIVPVGTASLSTE